MTREQLLAMREQIDAALAAEPHKLDCMRPVSTTGKMVRTVKTVGSRAGSLARAGIGTAKKQLDRFPYRLSIVKK